MPEPLASQNFRSWRCIFLLGTVTGEPTEHDGRYVMAYDPTVDRPDGTYDGGILITTPDIRLAKRYKGVNDAYAEWYRPHPTRKGVKGKPERPLTAWNVSFPDAPDQGPLAVGEG